MDFARALRRGLIVAGSGRVARWHGGLPVGRSEAPRLGWGKSAAVRGRWSVPRRSWKNSVPSGAREPWEGRPRARERLIRRDAARAPGLQLGPQCGSPFVGHLAQIVLDARLAPLPPVGLEPPADLIDAAGQVDVQAVKVVAGSVAHRDSVLGPRSIGCWPPEPACRGQPTKTHFEEDVRFARDCDIALPIREFAGPRLFFASLSCNTFIQRLRELQSLMVSVFVVRAGRGRAR